MSRPAPPEELARRSDEQREADLESLARITARDAAGLTTLYDRHAAFLYGLLIHILGDRSAAEALLEKVFARVWDQTDVYDPALGSPRAWLVGLARRCAFEWLRPGDGREPPELQWPVHDGERRAAAALHALPAEERILIEYAFFRGLSSAELAAHFRLPLESVRTRMRTGMRLLTEMLAQLTPGTRRES